nr:hypothetical protein [uncultured Shinella sp.]
MKIDGSLISAYTPSRLRVTSDESTYSSGGTATARNIPTVGPASPLPKGLANALWLANAKQEKAQQARDDLMSEFTELARMTPAERIRKEILDEMGLTEEALAAMPKEEREATEEKIRRVLKERLGIDETQQAGVVEGQATTGTEEAEA